MRNEDCTRHNEESTRMTRMACADVLFSTRKLRFFFLFFAVAVREECSIRPEFETTVLRIYSMRLFIRI